MSKPTYPGDKRPHMQQLVPSALQTWEGMYVDGCAISGWQQEEATHLGLNWRTVETIGCTRQVLNKTFEFECPVIDRRRGQVKVISPRGYKVWIGDDGKITGKERTL